MTERAGVQPRYAPRVRVPGGSEDVDVDAYADGGRFRPLAAPRLMNATGFDGHPVLSRAGRRLGQVEAILLDVPRGRIAYAVLTDDASSRLRAVPWRALLLDTDAHSFVLDASPQRLRSAPSFDRSHWPSDADERWHREVHAHFCVPLYWD